MPSEGGCELTPCAVATTATRRSKETRTIYGANVVVFEGILTLHDPTLTALMDMRIFVDTDDDVRLARRCPWIRTRHSTHLGTLLTILADPRGCHA